MMSSVVRIINRGEEFDDSACTNKWRWEWISATTELHIFDENREERLGARFRNLNTNGTARCIVCDKDVFYRKRGKIEQRVT